MRKLFRDIPLDRRINRSLADSAQKSALDLTFRWTEEKKVVIYQLFYRLPGKEWIDALDNKPIADDDGTQTIYLGEFDHGTEVEIAAGIMAITNVPRAIMIISQDNPKLAYKIRPLPKNEVKKLDVADRWEEQFKYKVNENHIA